MAPLEDGHGLRYQTIGRDVLLVPVMLEIAHHCSRIGRRSAPLIPSPAAQSLYGLRDDPPVAALRRAELTQIARWITSAGKR